MSSSPSRVATTIVVVFLVTACSVAPSLAPITGTTTWEATGGMTEARFSHATTLLPDGKVLVAGGTRMASALVYTPESR
jgi:integral membrane sensor domain MASE1